MLKLDALFVSFAVLSFACSSSDTNGSGSTNGSDTGGSAGVSGAANAAGAGAGGSSDMSTSGSGGAGGASDSGGTTGGGVGGESAGVGGESAGAGGESAGTSGSGGTSTGGTGGDAGAGGMMASGGSVNAVPADYQGTPFAALTIPGHINAADYDRGGAGVAYCHDTGNCGGGTTTGDWPGGPPYRSPIPADAQICSGAACNDNVGVCRMNPSKPDNTIDGQPMPADATYLCYSTAGEWTKYTVVVMEAGTYSVSGVMGVQQEAQMNISFGDTITTGNVTLPVTPTTHSGSGEGFHSWDDRSNLATVTFPAAGTYLMTLTQVSRFNASSFGFSK